MYISYCIKNQQAIITSSAKEEAILEIYKILRYCIKNESINIPSEHWKEREPSIIEEMVRYENRSLCINRLSEAALLMTVNRNLKTIYNKLNETSHYASGILNDAWNGGAWRRRPGDERLEECEIMLFSNSLKSYLKSWNLIYRIGDISILYI